MKINVRPIVRELDLGEYAEVYQGQAVMVWVSPPVEFLNRRDELLVEYSQRFYELRRLQLRKVAEPGQRFTLTKVLPLPGKHPKQNTSSAGARKRPAAQVSDEAERLITEWNAWVAQDFGQRMNAWFAELWSQGPEETRWTAEELQAIERSDSVLLEWLKRRSMEMIQDYAAEKKRPSEPPSSS